MFKNLTHFNQEFIKLELQDINNEIEERFEFFKKRIWPQWQEQMNNNTLKKNLIFVSSYFEYLKLKNYFAKINAFG